MIFDSYQLAKITLRLNRLNVEYTFLGGYAKNPRLRQAVSKMVWTKLGLNLTSVVRCNVENS